MSTEFQYDVFLSHNQADEPWVQRLAERLQAAGQRAWPSEWEAPVAALRTLALCLSAAPQGSGWMRLERSAVPIRDPSKARRMLHAVPAGRLQPLEPGTTS
jgi:hypothetical protein